MSFIPWRPTATLLFVLACAATAAQAEWVAIGRNETMRAYMEQNTVQRDGERVLVLQMLDFVTAQWVDERTVIGSIRMRVEYDCATPRSRALTLEAFSEQMGEGSVVAKETVPDPRWEPIEPRSPNDRIRTAVCRQ